MVATNLENISASTSIDLGWEVARMFSWLIETASLQNKAIFRVIIIYKRSEFISTTFPKGLIGLYQLSEAGRMMHINIYFETTFSVLFRA